MGGSAIVSVAIASEPAIGEKAMKEVSIALRALKPNAA
jgi:hypothetical protein